MARPVTLFGVTKETADSLGVIKRAFNNESYKCNRNFGLASESGLRFSMFQSIDSAWANSIVYAPSASDGELMWSARKQRCGLARRGRAQQVSSEPRGNPAAQIDAGACSLSAR